MKRSIVDKLSDLRLKYIKEDFENGLGIQEDDIRFLMSRLRNFRHNDRDYDVGDIDNWGDDSVLQAYADHIRNYLYTYKPEAVEVDPSIDTEEEHIGPMAQDIEQVNPACIKETPEGVKTVDTGRLALMNAGAIGDLARQLQELIDKLRAAGLEV